MIGIYKITSPSGKIYIGQSVNFKKRITCYKALDCKKQIRLYNSFMKYGYINHNVEFIEGCLTEQLNKKERYWQDYYDVIGINGLNCVLTKTDELPQIISEESKLKSRFNNLGNKNPMYGKKGILNNKSKKVINLLENIVYNSLNECCELNNLNPKRMSRILSNSQQNKTVFMYFKEKGDYFNILKYKKIKVIKVIKTKEEIYINRSNAKLGMKNGMYGKFGKNNPASKSVINIITNQTWNSLKECCDENNLNSKYMSRWLSNTRPNKTNYKYL